MFWGIMSQNQLASTGCKGWGDIPLSAAIVAGNLSEPGYVGMDFGMGAAMVYRTCTYHALRIHRPSVVTCARMPGAMSRVPDADGRLPAYCHLHTNRVWRRRWCSQQIENSASAFVGRQRTSVSTSRQGAISWQKMGQALRQLHAFRL